AMILTQLGDAYRVVPENHKAVEYLTQSIALWQSLDDRRGELEALNAIAPVYYGTGEVAKSIVCLDRALELAAQLSDRDGELTAVNRIAMAYYMLGDFLKADYFWKKGL